MANAYLDKTDAFMRSLDLSRSFRVGGSVRDELIGRRVKDADYMVKGVGLDDLGRMLRAKGGDVTKLKLRDGRQVGWRYAERGLGCLEIALPRTEVSTGPGRHDFQIDIDPDLSIEEDAKRRDFTFNALYYHLRGDTIYDPTGSGLYDLQHKFINVTHPTSFRDDPLRVLRALRFVSTLGFELGSQTQALMVAQSDSVTGLTQKGVSGTAFEELCKLLMGDNVADALRLARDVGVLEVLLPELAPMLGFEQGSRYHDMTTDEHVFTALATAAHVDAPLRVRLALLFHDSGKPATAWIGKDGRKHYYAQSPKDDLIDSYDGHVNLDHEEQSEYLWREASGRLNVPKRLRDDVARLIASHMVGLDKPKGSKVRRARVEFGDELLSDLYLHRMCDLTGKGTPNTDHMAAIAALEGMRQVAQSEGVPAGVKDLEIDGNDVKSMGADGRDIGRVLSAVLDDVVCQPTPLLRTREWQLDRAEREVRASSDL